MTLSPIVSSSSLRRSFSAEPYFLLRAPAFPISDLAAWISAADGITDEFERRRLLRSSLSKRFLNSAALLDALTVASPHTATALHSECRGEPRSEKERRRLEETLVKYFSRAHGRATPFGLFAGTNVGTFASSTTMSLARVDEHRRVVRLDFSVLGSIVDCLIKRRDVRRASRYRVNSSLYHCAGWVRYVEWRGDTRRDVHYELTGIQSTDALERLLSFADSRLVAWQELVDVLRPEYDDLSEIEGFLDELIDAQVLVTELECPVTCDDALSVLVDQLSRMAIAPQTVEALRRIMKMLRELEEPGATITGKSLDSIRRELATVGTPDFPDNLLSAQLQLTPVAPLTLHDRVRGEIDCALEYLVAIGSDVPSWFTSAEEELRAFREAFQRRYDDAMVPLATALDAENGIGFGGAWFKSAVERTSQARKRSQSNSWEGHLAERLARLSPHEHGELVLTATDLEHLTRDFGSPPSEFIQAFVQLDAASPEAIDRGDFLIHVDQCCGPTEASLAARFAVGNPDLAERLRRTVADVESQDHRILAEIAHIPGSRAGNIVVRPRLSKYEIPYLARSEAPDADQITIRDLFLFVEADRLVLWSQRLGKEVLPRMSSAHATLANGQLPIYRFLYALHAQQRNCVLAWSWGTLQANAWLPRVRVGRVVLSLARWRISAATAKGLKSASRQAQAGLVASLRAEVGLPRYLSVDAVQQGLILDLDNELARDVFVDRLNTAHGSVVTEVFPYPESGGLVSSHGRHTFELVVPLRTDFRRPHSSAARETARVTHAPGGRWLTLKIYTGQVTADRILRDILAPAIAELEAKQLVKRWFFLRYADTDFHLRVRFEGHRDELWPEVLPAMHEQLQPLIDNGAVFQTVIDSYRPEFHRYGGPEVMEIAHEMFCADSRGALEVLTHLPDSASGPDRLLCAIVGVNGYYDAFAELGVPHMLATESALERLGSSLWDTELAATAGRRRNGQAFRQIRASIEELLSSPARGHLAGAIAPIARRDAALREQVGRLREASCAGKLTQRPVDLLLSYTHMHVNRILREYDRSTELRVYDALYRHYQSVFARKRIQRSGEIERIQS